MESDVVAAQQNTYFLAIVIWQNCSFLRLLNKVWNIWWA